MDLNQEFHEHLQAGRLKDAISLVVGQLVELKITTKANSGRLHTTVDLLNGQITNTVDPAFFSDKSSQKLLEFHTNQITATSQVVREQLRSLQDLLQALNLPEAPRESIKLIAITEGASAAIEPISSLVAAPIAIISAQTSETLPVILTKAVPEISAPSRTEQFNEILAPEHSPVSQPKPLIAQTSGNSSTFQPEPQVAKIVEHPAISQAAKAPDHLEIFEPEDDFEITAADLESLSAQTEKSPESDRQASWYENRSEHVKLPETPPVPKPESRAGIASGLAAALAQTSALDPSEAAAIPNKFDQALRSAGVRSISEDPHPFAAKSVAQSIVTQPAVAVGAIEQPTELIPRRELIDLLRESEDDWDEWLLEEDNILTELSDVTKDKVGSHWLSGATSGSVSVKSSPSDWEEFMPEYPEVNAVASKNQANVERFRQNLVNDPQLMSELLAELDDLEEMEEGKPKL